MFKELQTRLRWLAAVCAFFSIAATGSVAAGENFTVTLKKESVIEIAFVDIKHGQKDTFLNEYLANIEPIINDHGGRLVARFETFDVIEGQITPQYVLLLDWPSVGAFDAATKDQRLEKYLPFREQSLRALHFGLFSIEKDVSITLKKGIVYEFFAGNPGTPKAPELLGQFFQKVIPTAMQYGRGTLLELGPVSYEGDNYNRLIAGVATWPSAAHFFQFTNTSVFREGVEEFRNPALAEQEIINTYYISK